MSKNIDPPYNTGTDGFVYPDNFKFDAKELSKAIGIEEEEATRILNLAGKSSHSAWLTFMYPRLILARDLLSEDGIIFISIDDNEQANLKLVCDEIFGEENYLSDIIWEKRFTRSNNAQLFASVVDHILCYRKSEAVSRLRAPRTEKSDQLYSNPDNDPRGDWTSVSYVNPASKEERPNLVYKIINPFTNEEVEHPTNAWKYEINTHNQHVAENKLYWGVNGENTYPRLKKFLSEVSDGMVPINLLSYEEVGTTDAASKDLEDLMGGKVFDFPKPVELIRTLAFIGGVKPGSTMLDFFSGSATTAHAVMNLNAEDSGNRKYIMVQLPEIIDEKKPAYKAGYRTIDEIGMDRIRRAAKQIQAETGADINYGFKAFRLEPVSQNTLNKMIYFDPSATFLTEDMISVFDTEYASGLSSILATWLNEDGYGLTAKAKDYLLKDFRASIIENTLYIIKEGLRTEDVMELVKRLETMELDVSRIIVYPYSVEFSVMHELKKNIKNLRNNKSVEVIERY